MLAGLAKGSMRGKNAQLLEALTGRSSDHHGFLLARLLGRIDAITADIDAVAERIETRIAPFAQPAARLDAIPGVGVTAAQIIIAEVGLDMSRFPPPPAGVVGRVRPGCSGRQRSGAVAPPPSWGNATGASAGDGGPTGPLSRSVGPS